VLDEVVSPAGRPAEPPPEGPEEPAAGRAAV
jgi:hypothetical protein